MSALFASALTRRITSLARQLSLTTHSTERRRLGYVWSFAVEPAAGRPQRWPPQPPAADSLRGRWRPQFAKHRHACYMCQFGLRLAQLILGSLWVAVTSIMAPMEFPTVQLDL